jgi:hypothetical protein
MTALMNATFSSAIILVIGFLGALPDLISSVVAI